MSLFVLTPMKILVPALIIILVAFIGLAMLINYLYKRQDRIKASKDPED